MTTAAQNPPTDPIQDLIDDLTDAEGGLLFRALTEHGVEPERTQQIVAAFGAKWGNTIGPLMRGRLMHMLADAESAAGLDDTGKTLTQMTAEVRSNNIQKGWRTGGNTFGDHIALMHSELSEALEAYRDHRLNDATPEWIAFSFEDTPMPKPEGVGSEFADVLIRLLDAADIYGIDLDAEYERKMAYNRTRPYQHGGRTLSDEGQATVEVSGA